AHVEGLACSTLDFTGLSQKNGAVMSHVRLAPASDMLTTVRIAHRAGFEVDIGIDHEARGRQEIGVDHGAGDAALGAAQRRH
ncbi:hypothetical protein E3H11_43795, partial [Bradyrhizobium brasilense]|uniref:hypothetical protein n=1 Tax=Bradyrhizobium brasilense TaxID=1419277 RepID=UPI001456B971